jgi:hypothetical protein
MLRTQLLALEIPIGNPYPVDGDTRRYDPITAVTGGLGIVSNIAGGLLGASAAKKAAAVQQQSANAEAAKVDAAAGIANQGVNDAGVRAGEMATTAAKFGADQTQEAAGNARDASLTATREANAKLDPYAEAGGDATRTLQEGLKTGGDFNRTFTAKDLQSDLDPGYQFRLEQGQLGLNRTAAARGGALSGAAVKDALNYNSGLASQETQNAFNRYSSTTQSRYDRLFGVSRQGEGAATHQGDNLTADARYGGTITTGAAQFGAGLNTSAAEYSGTAGTHAADVMGENLIGSTRTAADLRTGGAAAKAAGIVGGTNALTKGLTGATSSALTLSQLLKNPAVAMSPGGLKTTVSKFNPEGLTA